MEILVGIACIIGLLILLWYYLVYLFHLMIIDWPCLVAGISMFLCAVPLAYRSWAKTPSSRFKFILPKQEYGGFVVPVDSWDDALPAWKGKSQIVFFLLGALVAFIVLVFQLYGQQAVFRYPPYPKLNLILPLKSRHEAPTWGINVQQPIVSLHWKQRMVEAPGVEPGSENLPRKRLHAFLRLKCRC